MIKQCSSCKQSLLLSEFHKDKSKKDGLCHKCKSCKKLCNKRWSDNNRDRRRVSATEYRVLNKGKIATQQRAWYYRNKTSVPPKGPPRATAITCPILRKLKHNIRCLVRKSYNRQGYRKSSKTQDILGCDFATFQQHLQATFIENYGILPSEYPDTELHMDHIVPVSSAKNEQEMLELNHFTNLQLLFATDNMKKGVGVHFLDEVEDLQ